jgi:hypothetical protein
MAAFFSVGVVSNVTACLVMPCDAIGRQAIIHSIHAVNEVEPGKLMLLAVPNPPMFTKLPNNRPKTPACQC